MLSGVSPSFLRKPPQLQKPKRTEKGELQVRRGVICNTEKELEAAAENTASYIKKKKKKTLCEICTATVQNGDNINKAKETGGFYEKYGKV